MLTIIVLVWISRNPADRWVEARNRAELLRREQFLRLAAAGPYQNLNPEQAEQLTVARIALFGDSTGERLRRLLSMRTETGPTRWIDQLWTQPNPALDSLRERARTYLHYRVGKQIVWFTLGTRLNHDAERRIAYAIKCALIGTVIVIGLQTVLLLTSPGINTATITATATVLTLILPPACAFLLAIQELYSYRRLAISYRQMLDILADERAVFAGLIATIDNEPDVGHSLTSRQFQAAVLHTEEALTHELQRWTMFTQRDKYDLSL
jgi:hypothetical protein